MIVCLLTKLSGNDEILGPISLTVTADEGRERLYLASWKL